jgi:uncharacterized protein YciI
MTPEQRTLEQLLEAVANIKFFVIFMKPTDAFQPLFASEEARQVLTEHLLYLREIERTGRLYASGPIDSDGEGMCIVRTADREDAERIAYAEPFHKAGWRINSVRSWQLNEGLLVECAKELTSAS